MDPPIKMLIEPVHLWYKLGAAASLFILTILFGLVPFLLACLRPNKGKHFLMDSILDVINAFSGGVLMSVGILHILVDSNHLITEAIEQMQNQTMSVTQTILLSEKKHEGEPFPYANMLFALGLLTMFFLDKLLESFSIWVNKKFKKHAEHDHHHHESEMATLTETKPVDLDLFHDNHSHDHTSHHVESMTHGTKGQRFVGGLILWISLVLHSVFEGLGLGSATSERFGDLLIAIVSHHLVSALLLGSVLEQKLKKIWFSLFFLISFALSIPVGVAIGLLITSFDSVSFVLLQGISLAIASGVFIYVACFEILANFDPFHPPLLLSKIVMFTVGFFAMVIVIIV